MQNRKERLLRELADYELTIRHAKANLRCGRRSAAAWRKLRAQHLNFTPSKAVLAMDSEFAARVGWLERDVARWAAYAEETKQKLRKLKEKK